METAANKKKVTYRFYSVDAAALDATTAALRKLEAQMEFDRSDVLRALVHATPEVDLEALGILRSRYERAGGALPPDDQCNIALTLRLPLKDEAKVKAVAQRIKARKVSTSEGELIRALAHVQRDWKLFLPEFTAYLSEFPDGRELRWKSPRS